jgi:Ca2+:H+ antiporter
LLFLIIFVKNFLNLKNQITELKVKYVKFLLIFFPVSIVLELLHFNGTAIFITSCLSIIPLAGIMGEATENLAAKLGPRVGGILNATFGNATELIIAVFALRAGQFDVVKASIAGSIIGNILLVLGASMFIGGIKHKVQSFSKKAVGNSSSLLLFAIIGFAIPAVFLGNVKENELLNFEGLSILIAVVMIIIYICGIIFSFYTHKDILGIDHSEDVEPKWNTKTSIAVLFASTIGIAISSEFLVGSIEEVTKVMGWNEMFIGIIVLAVIGNAAEHSTAIMMALKNKMDVAIEIAVGSSLQIALFVAPLLVFISLIIGRPMSLIFNVYELTAIIASVFIANIVSHDGESNWLEGLQLIGVYIIIAFGFFFIK